MGMEQNTTPTRVTWRAVRSNGSVATGAGWAVQSLGGVFRTRAVALVALQAAEDFARLGNFGPTFSALATAEEKARRRVALEGFVVSLDGVTLL